MPNPSGPNNSEPLQLLTRAGCGLCEQFELELAQLAQQHALPPVQILDIDDFPQLVQRYGLDVPVLLWDGVKVCEHRLDAAELLRLLRPR